MNATQELPDRHTGAREAAKEGRPRRSAGPQARAVERAFRPPRVVPAVVAALLLIGVGGLVAAGVVAALVGRPLRFLPSVQVTAAAREVVWSDTVVLAAAAFVAALGAVACLLALVPGRSRFVPLVTHDPRFIACATRPSVRRVLAGAAVDVDGVARARVRLRRNRVAVRVTSRLRDTSGIPDQVHAAVRERLAAVAPLRPHRVKIRVRRKGD